MSDIVKGGQLMVFVGGKSIAAATNHTLSLNVDTVDSSNKDLAGGKWASEEPDKINWSMTTENLFTFDNTVGKNYDDLMGILISRQKVDIVFALAATLENYSDETVTEVPTGGWVKSTTQKWYSGQAYITALDVNAQNGENATFTATFTGAGALVQNNATA